MQWTYNAILIWIKRKINYIITKNRPEVNFRPGVCVRWNLYIKNWNNDITDLLKSQLVAIETQILDSIVMLGSFQWWVHGEKIFLILQLLIMQVTHESMKHIM